MLQFRLKKTSLFQSFVDISIIVFINKILHQALIDISPELRIMRMILFFSHLCFEKKSYTKFKVNI